MVGWLCALSTPYRNLTLPRFSPSLSSGTNDSETEVHVVGYLQVSITVVGPGEHKPKHDRVAEKKEEQAKADARAAKRGSRSTMHIPPHVLTKSGMKATEYLTLRFYEATNLPTLNKDSGRYVVGKARG